MAELVAEGQSCGIWGPVRGGLPEHDPAGRTRCTPITRGGDGVGRCGRGRSRTRSFPLCQGAGHQCRAVQPRLGRGRTYRHHRLPQWTCPRTTTGAACPAYAEGALEANLATVGRRPGKFAGRPTAAAPWPGIAGMAAGQGARRSCRSPGNPADRLPSSRNAPPPARGRAQRGLTSRGWTRLTVTRRPRKTVLSGKLDRRKPRPAPAH